ncbi:hypothetical protein EVAR_22964_1 [Eumeta japonica]|uniref:Uncharacterized protein n=1 Tax=Eumeta variegata TaxID=151549 RepID=A0A4C1UPW2_EUMVA|nr:hypothetical protein EVAR_22964_1 [Eumeta japonica]
MVLNKITITLIRTSPDNTSVPIPRYVHRTPGPDFFLMPTFKVARRRLTPQTRALRPAPNASLVRGFKFKSSVLARCTSELTTLAVGATTQPRIEKKLIQYKTRRSSSKQVFNFSVHSERGVFAMCTHGTSLCARVPPITDGTITVGGLRRTRSAGSAPKTMNCHKSDEKFNKPNHFRATLAAGARAARPRRTRRL